ncbi:hypothetical protein [Alicyclobacillus fodiniaquatilis]|uniref:HEPN domain-containing protein n=1 Tax=Alicyclobacillus fodiniaquatilis TaxID=1661150 RepID=A0ABW4JI90_9BACL
MATEQSTMLLNFKSDDCACLRETAELAAKGIMEFVSVAQPCFMKAAKEGWFVFDGIIGPYGLLLLKSATVDEQDISPERFVDVLERTMRIYYLTDLNISVMGEIWAQKEWAKARYPIFREAVACYKSGLYHASVSTALPLVEGILTARSGLEPFSPIKALKRRAREIDASGQLSVVIDNLYKDTRTFDWMLEKSLNRHGVSHGVDLNFGTKRKALQMIALLNALVNI